MKDFDGIILFIFGAAFITTLFFGAKSFIKKAVGSASSIQQSDEREQRVKDQRDQMREVQDRQKRLMEDRQQKLRDMQRK